MRHKHIFSKAIADFIGRRTFEKQLQCFPEIIASRLNTVPLTGNIQFRAQCNKAIIFPLYDGCQSFIHWLEPKFDQRETKHIAATALKGIVQ